MSWRSMAAVAGVGCGVCVLMGAPRSWQLGLTFVTAIVAVRLVVSAVAPLRLASTLRRVSEGGSVAGVAVRLVPATDVLAVAGLWRPAIFCDPSTLAPLTDAEQRAVLLHELGHLRRRDPARLLLLSVLSPAVGRTRFGAAWLQGRRASLEIAADRHALAAGAERAALASALLRVGASVQPAGAATFGPRALDLRLAALLDGRPVAHRRAGWLLGVATVVVVGLCTAVLAANVPGLADAVACVVGACVP